jgi:hypothetical protein
MDAAALEVLMARQAPRDGVGRVGTPGGASPFWATCWSLGRMKCRPAPRTSPEHPALQAVASDPLRRPADAVSLHASSCRSGQSAANGTRRQESWPRAPGMLADAGDVILLVKGSKGSKVSRVVDALRKTRGTPAAADSVGAEEDRPQGHIIITARTEGDYMLSWLTGRSDGGDFFNLFPLHHLPGRWRFLQRR